MGSISAYGQLDRRFFFDADNSSFNFKTTQQKFEGNVVMIGAGLIISADNIEINSSQKSVEANGNVVFLTKDQVFVGKHLTYYQENDRIIIEEGSLIFNGKEAVDKAVDQILGFSKAEFEFEKKRNDQQSRILQTIKLLIDSYAELPDIEKVSRKQEYASKLRVYLEQRDLVLNQPNQIFNMRTDKVQESLKRRRRYWQENKVNELLEGTNLERLGYFKIEGMRLEKINSDEFIAHKSFFTSCLCEEDEKPAWAFWADTIKVKIDNYADMWHPILKIKGVPVLYLPYLRIPVKQTRQSGLLLPNFTYSEYSGSTFTQPLFIDLGHDKDLTITEKFYFSTTELNRSRGLLHELEYRQKLREYSGWNISLGLINDNVWRQERGNRLKLRDMYLDGLAAARANPNAPSSGVIGDGEAGARARIAEPGFWIDNGKSECLTGSVEFYNSCRSNIYEFTDTPTNPLRGFANWQGLNILAPRLSVVSTGEYNSDHRYGLDFDSGYDILRDELQKQFSKPYKRSLARIHYDQSDYYLGVGTSFGDNIKLQKSYMGRQIPFYTTFHTRLFNLLPDSAYIPLYASSTIDYRRLMELDGDEYKDLTRKLTLGSGDWTRASVEVISPLVSGWIFQIDHFTEVETRLIKTELLSENDNGKLSMRTGLNLKLPIDGKLQLPDFLLFNSNSKEDRHRYVHHLMSWDIGFSFRPFVKSWGPYATSDKPGGLEETGLSYFPTDRAYILPQNENSIIDEEVFVRHQRLSFATRHFFRLYDDIATYDTMEFDKVVGDTALDYNDRAISILDQAAKDVVNGGDRKSLPYTIPLSFGMSIDYDFLDAEKRREQKESNPDNEILAEPWKELKSDATLRAMGFAFDYRSNYNTYSDTFTKNTFGLRLPTFFKTEVGLSYSVEKDKLVGEEGRVDFTYTQAGRISTEIIPNFQVMAYIADRRLEKLGLDERNELQSRYAITYISPSKCWGVHLARLKDFHLKEREASYLLRFEASFAGYTRQLPNMAKLVIPKDYRK